MKKIISVLLILFVISTMITTAGAETEGKIRVGLYYGSNGLPSANLANEEGSGYWFGYFDSSRTFIPVAATQNEKITMMKDKTMYVYSGTYYDALPPSGAVTIGAYHVDAGFAYPSFEAAQLEAGVIASIVGLNAFPAYINGEYRVRIGAYTSSDAAASAINSIMTALAAYDTANGTAASRNFAAVGGSSTCITVTITSTGQIIFEFDCQTNKYFAVSPTGADRPTTWFKGYCYAGCFEYRRNNGNDITVINVISYTEYAKGVVPYEMSPNWPAEAIKAQAICAMSFAVANRNKHSSMGFDICNTVDCQVYRGRNRATAASDAAVEAVAGLAIYSGGKICNAVYHSSNGGYTEDVENVWGTRYAYLRGVPDNFEDLKTAINGTWSFTYTGDQISAILRAKGYSISKVTDAYVSQFTNCGNVYSITFVDNTGKTLTISKEKARTALNSDTYAKYTYSQRFVISGGSRSVANVSVNAGSTLLGTAKVYAKGANGTIGVVSLSGASVLSGSGRTTLETISSSAPTGSFTISGWGWGHNVGMSQNGAKGMALLGYTYDRILKYYYTGVEILPIS